MSENPGVDKGSKTLGEGPGSLTEVSNMTRNIAMQHGSISVWNSHSLLPSTGSHLFRALPSLWYHTRD